MLNRRFLTPPPSASVANGVYLQDIKGNFYKKGAYYGGIPLNGVAVISDDLSIVGSVWALAHGRFIYPDNAAEATIRESTSLSGPSLWSNIPIYASVAEARSGLDGLSLTTLLSNYVNGKSISVFNYPDLNTYTVSVSAMQYCSSYTFPSGAMGWLPSVSELELWLSHAQEITELLEDVSSRLFGGLYYYGVTDTGDLADDLFSRSYWTSSRASNKSVASLESLYSTDYVQYYRSLTDSLGFTPAVITSEVSPDYYYRPFTSIEVPAVGVPQSECTISLYRGALSASQPVASDVMVVVRRYESGAWRTGSYVIPSGETGVYWGNGIIGGESFSVPYIYPSYDWKYNYVLDLE